MRYLNYLFLSLLFLLFACTSTEGLSKYDDTEIVFGNGGGFSGQEFHYTLSNDGSLSLYNTLTRETTKMDGLKKKQTLKIFQQADDVLATGTNFNDPGNKYYFVKQVRGKDEQKIVWGGDNQKVPAGIQDFYNELMNFVKQ